MRKKKNNKLIKGCLCIFIGILFICLTYIDTNTNKENDLITYNLDIFTNVDQIEVLDILDNETCILLIIDDRLEINRILSILTTINTNYNIYVYNSKYDRLILGTNENGIYTIQEPTTTYNLLLDKLGSYKEKYILHTTSGNLIETDYYNIITPMVLFINNGDIVFSNYIHDDKVTDTELKELYELGITKLNNFTH